MIFLFIGEDMGGLLILKNYMKFELEKGDKV